MHDGIWCQLVKKIVLSPAMCDILFSGSSSKVFTQQLIVCPETVALMYTVTPTHITMYELLVDHCKCCGSHQLGYEEMHHLGVLCHQSCVDSKLKFCLILSILVPLHWLY